MDAALHVPDHVAPDRVVDFDIYFDPRVDEDVFGSYARILGDAPPVFWTPRNGGHWIVKGFDEICETVRTPHLFSSRNSKIPRNDDSPRLIPVNLDPPHNVPFRQAMMPAFSPKAVKALEPKIRDWAQHFVAAVAPLGECDFAYDVASVFPVTVFMELMGMPRERLREFRTMADAIFRARSPEALAAAFPALHGSMAGLIEERQAAQGDDVVSQLIRADLQGLGRKMTAEELLQACSLLFLGGMDTVTNATGFTYQQFAKDPKLQAFLAANPERIPDFVDEGLRMHAVVSSPRVVAQDCEMFGVRFREGEMIMNALALGGRDPRITANPDVFDLDRPNKQPMAFSTGPHLCIGHILARAEMRILTEEWLKAIPSFRLKPGVEHLFRLGTVNALQSLPLEWDVEA